MAAESLQDVARLTDPEFFAGEPLEVYARLRREAPVFRYEPGHLWAISKYDDVKAVVTAPRRFSSAYGLVPSDSPPPDDGSPVDDSDGMPREALVRRRVWEQKWPGSEVLVSSDPPRHTVLRRLVSYAFTPKMLAALEQTITELATEAVAAIEPGSVVDVVDAVAAPIPLTVIAKMLGVPDADLDLFRRWSDMFVSTTHLHNRESMAHIAEQLRQFSEYFAAALVERASKPRDDILTALVQAEADGERLSPQNQLSMVKLLLIAGNETTRSLLSGTVKLLAEHPDQRAALVERPELLASAVEEFLRCVSPVPTFGRTALEPLEMRGTTIEKGDYVVVLYASANRDEDTWADAETFDVTRQPDPQHLAFGFGEHYCVGSQLARREAKVVIGELLRRFPTFELAGPVERLPSTSTPGIAKLPICFA